MAGLVITLRGRRLILINADGNHDDYRAWGELRTSAGRTVVDAVSEVDWWRHENLAMRPRSVIRWPATAAWVEMDRPEA